VLDDRDVANLMPAITPDTVGLSQSVARVVFVCTHNSARSQLAAAEWQRMSHVPCTSAGTHPASRVHPRAVVTGRRHGLPLKGAKTATFADSPKQGDLIVAVCDRAHEELPVVARDGATQTMHWSVPDPVRVDTDAAFESAYRDISMRVERLSAAMTESTGVPHPNRRS
jgi:protein-tyrosine-phosphatase